MLVITYYIDLRTCQYESDSCRHNRCLFSCQHSFLLLLQLPKFSVEELLLVHGLRVGHDLGLPNGSSGWFRDEHVILVVQ